MAREDLVLIHDRLADEVRDFGRVDLVALGAFDLLHDNQLFVAEFAGHREGGTAIGPKRRMHRLNLCSMSCG